MTSSGVDIRSNQGAGDYSWNRFATIAPMSLSWVTSVALYAGFTDSLRLLIFLCLKPGHELPSQWKPGSREETSAQFQLDFSMPVTKPCSIFRNSILLSASGGQPAAVTIICIVVCFWGASGASLINTWVIAHPGTMIFI